MTHPLTAAKVDKPATLAQRSAAASRVEMATDVAAAGMTPFWLDVNGGACTMHDPNGGKHTFAGPTAAQIVCDYCNAAFKHGQRTANAELVEALREMLVLADLDGGNFVKPTSPTLIRARAALAKHGGQQ